MKTLRLLLSIVVSMCLSSHIGLAENSPLDALGGVEGLINSQQQPLLQKPDFSRDSADLRALYQSNANQLLWFGQSRTQKNIDDLLVALSNAGADGLNPANYDVDRLKQYAQQAATLSTMDNQQQLTGIDLAFSVVLLRFSHDLYQGQINPAEVNYPIDLAQKTPLDRVALLKQQLDSQTLSDLPSLLEPKIKQYQQLKQALSKLRQIPQAVDSVTLQISKPLRPGERHPQLSQVRQRLSDMGELSQVYKGKADIYDEATVKAIKKFQQQQGLKTDGILGSSTAQLLMQSPAEKITQIELTMERLRWLPEVGQGPMIVVNIPAFQLWAFNSVEDAEPLNMKVVVGKSEQNQTPMLWEEMKYLEFMPYWNIPKNIMDKEILPKLLANADYLATQDMEIVHRQAAGEQGNSNLIDDIKQGRVRARQRPGKRNPLGRVKFIFPNKADVYMHDTPSRSAFSRDRRDLSHGCVRVSEPAKLAEFVLSSQEGWSKETIQQAMSGSKTQRVTLKKTVPVLFFYSTSFVDHTGQLRFYPDIYGQDAILQKALNKPVSNQEGIVVTKVASNGG